MQGQQGGGAAVVFDSSRTPTGQVSQVLHMLSTQRKKRRFHAH